MWRFVRQRHRQTENDRQNAHTIVFVVKLKIKQVLPFFWSTRDLCVGIKQAFSQVLRLRCAFFCPETGYLANFCPSGPRIVVFFKGRHDVMRVSVFWSKWNDTQNCSIQLQSFRLSHSKHVLSSAMIIGSLLSWPYWKREPRAAYPHFFVHMILSLFSVLRTGTIADFVVFWSTCVSVHVEVCRKWRSSKLLPHEISVLYRLLSAVKMSIKLRGRLDMCVRNRAEKMMMKQHRNAPYHWKCAPYRAHFWHVPHTHIFLVCT